MMSRSAFLAAAATLSLVLGLGPACSSTPATTAQPDAGPVGSKGPQFGPDGKLLPPPAGSPVIQFGPVTVAPQAERTQCITKRLGNEKQLRVNRIQNRLGDASHHLIVYRVSNDQAEQLEPKDCDPFADTLKPERGSPLMITQKYEEELQLPPGVAFTLAPNQMIRLEMHFVNASAEAKELKATSTFIEIPEKDFKDEADFMFIGNPDIKIPPKSKFTLGPSFLPLPETHEGVHFFAVTGHQHKMGKNVKVEVATAKEDAAPKAVYDVKNWQWAEPETVFHDPPFDIPKGGGFRFTCDFENVTDKELKFGEKANDEMCFFWAYYYPSNGPQVCVHTDKAPSGSVDLCCPGDLRCGFLFNDN